MREDPFHTLFLFSFGAVLDVIEPQIYILIKKVEKKREPTIYSKEYIFKLDEPIFCEAAWVESEHLHHQTGQGSSTKGVPAEATLGVLPITKLRIGCQW